MNQIMHTPSTASVEAIDLSNVIEEESIVLPEGEILGPSVGIVFGRERTGLTNDELALADSTIYIPANENYSVLNLAQAVNIVGYELFKRQLELKDKVRDGGVLSLRTTDRLANREELDRFLSRLKDHLLSRGYKAISKNNDENGESKTGLKDLKIPKENRGLVRLENVIRSSSENVSSIVENNNSAKIEKYEKNEKIEKRYMSATEMRNETNGEDHYRDLKFRSLQAIFIRVGNPQNSYI